MRDDRNILKEQLLYNGTKSIPQAFKEYEVNQIVQELLKTDKYTKSEYFKDWRNFFRLRDVCLILTMALTGLRPKEACCLRFDDLDLKAMTIKVRGVNNKCNKTRIIPLPSLLMRYYKPYFNLLTINFSKGSDYLFPSIKNNYISPSTLKAIIREKALKPLGLWNIQRDFKAQYRTLYKLRHYYATSKMEKMIKERGSCDLYALANLLGHSNLNSTKVYLSTADKNYQEYLREITEL